ncbi:MAG TPA: type II toxin-antitoxin system HicA family toxin [Candidatus Nanoarchaeia archaeon]|nr:type II toxin-antitoxin system HicA family toxin [Candidatus Nanoarchaeia archaeon]
MGRLPRLTGKELIKLLTKTGYSLVRIEGSHHILRKPDGQIVSVPVHAGEEIGTGLLTRIIKK